MFCLICSFLDNCSLSFYLCIFCSSVYDFRLPLWCIQTSSDPPFRHLTTYASPDANSNPESSLESLTKDSYLLYSDSKVRSLLDSFRHHYSLEQTSSCQSVVIFLLSLKQFFTSKFRSYISEVSFAHKQELKYRSYY